MTSPKDTRPFSLEMAQQGHPLVTRDGRPAKFIAYVPENLMNWRVVVAVDEKIRAHCTDGSCYVDEDISSNDLFLAPLGWIDNKPVFAGDILVQDFHPHKEIIVEVDHRNFSAYKWPSKAPVVETKLSDAELMQAYFPYGKLVCAVSDLQDYRRIANKAIERAIADGDVTPTSVVYKLLDEVKYKYDCGAGHNMSYSCTVESVMDDYLKGLK